MTDKADERRLQRMQWHSMKHERATKRFQEETARMATVHICEFVCGLPEGGEFRALWPETIEPASVEMVAELFRLQWETVRRMVDEREAEIDAAGIPVTEQDQQVAP